MAAGHCPEAWTVPCGSGMWRVAGSCGASLVTAILSGNWPFLLTAGGYCPEGAGARFGCGACRNRRRRGKANRWTTRWGAMVLRLGSPNVTQRLALHSRQESPRRDLIFLECDFTQGNVNDNLLVLLGEFTDSVQSFPERLH